tara:strand:+ start:34 stop:1062 length:1029 start_codon:yes stop_codon:yes gene_type:complete
MPQLDEINEDGKLLIGEEKVIKGEDGEQLIIYKPTLDFFWIHGIEEYLTHIDHPQLDMFMNIKKAILHGNIWKMKRLIIDEINRGRIEFSEEFINILMSHHIGWKYVTHRKIARYIAHCIDDEYIRRISSWCIKWETQANLNEHFSRGQMCSKLWMVDELKKIVTEQTGIAHPPKLGTVVQYGGWYATVAQLFFQNFDIKKYLSLEKDVQCIQMADDFNYVQTNNQWQFKSVWQDVDNITYDDEASFIVGTKNIEGDNVEIWVQPNLVINTSCEHMDETWFERLPEDTFVCLQTNDYFSNSQHINCVKNVIEAKKKYPMRTIYYEGELDTQLYNRFMLIGKK